MKRTNKMKHATVDKLRAKVMHYTMHHPERTNKEICNIIRKQIPGSNNTFILNTLRRYGMDSKHARIRLLRRMCVNSYIDPDEKQAALFVTDEELLAHACHTLAFDMFKGMANDKMYNEVHDAVQAAGTDITTLCITHPTLGIDGLLDKFEELYPQHVEAGAIKQAVYMYIIDTGLDSIESRSKLHEDFVAYSKTKVVNEVHIGSEKQLTNERKQCEDDCNTCDFAGGCIDFGKNVNS